MVLEFSNSFDFINAIEANPANFFLLKLNILINKKINIKPHHLLASDNNKEINFLLNTVNSGRSKRMPLIKDVEYFNDNPTQLKMKGVILDNYFSDKNFNFVLMDIEGSEIFALRGMNRILKNAFVLQIEFIPKYIRDVAGSNVDEFCDLIFPYFDKVLIPSQKIEIEVNKAKEILSRMYNANIGDEGIIFRKLT